MRTIAFTLALCLLTGLGLANGPALARAAGHLTVAATIEPQAYFLRKVGGERVDIVTLVPAGADPHVYEPKPGQMKALAKAAAYFSVGLELEEAWLPKFRAANPAMLVVPTDAGIAKSPMAEEEPEAGHGHGKEEHQHGLLDPHVWLSPALAKIQAATMRDALARLDPSGADEYAANYATFAAECDALARDLAVLLADLPSREFMVFHPSWGYYARDFGLTQVSIEVEGKEPSPKMLRHIVDQGREHGIKAIFVAPQFSRRTAQVVAQEIGAVLVEADPLADDWADNLRRVARSLAVAATRK